MAPRGADDIINDSALPWLRDARSSTDDTFEGVACEHEKYYNYEALRTSVRMCADAGKDVGLDVYPPLGKRTRAQAR